MRGLITVVNDNHVDNYLKKNFAFVYFGSTVNTLPNNGIEGAQEEPQSQNIAHQ